MQSESLKGKKNKGLHKYALEIMGAFQVYIVSLRHLLASKAINTVTFKAFVENLKASLTCKLLKILLKKKILFIFKSTSEFVTLVSA